MNPLKWIDGYKTEIGLIAAAVVAIAVSQGWLTIEQGGAMEALILAFTGVAIRHTKTKNAKQIKELHAAQTDDQWKRQKQDQAIRDLKGKLGIK